jgi:hypothetical protein
MINICYCITYSSAGIATGSEWAGQPRNHSSILDRGKRFLSSPFSIQTDAGANPASCLMNRALSPRVKWPGHEADWSPPPIYFFMVWCLIN